jgi:hypothetical protein
VYLKLYFLYNERVKIRSKYLLLHLITYLCFIQSSFSIGFEDGVYPELATSARALAMGNAFISKVDDSSSPFYNPAGLGTVRYKNFHLSNLHIETNKGWNDVGTGGNISKAFSNFNKALKLDGMRILLRENVGVTTHARYHLTPNFTTRYFSAGYLYAKRSRAIVQNGFFEYATRLDHGPYAAFNLSLFGGVIKFGLSGILLLRKEAQDNVNPDIAIDLQDSEYKKGIAAVATAGFKLAIPWKFLPTFAWKMNNAFGQNFSSSGAGAPDSILPSHDLGFSLTPQIGKFVRVHFEVNVKDVTGQFTGLTFVRKLTLGTELDVARKFFLRIGYSDGFGAGGIGMRTKAFSMDLTTYAVDTIKRTLGSTTLRGKEDRRFALSISTGF